METDGVGVRELQITMETDDPAPGLGLDHRFSMQFTVLRPGVGVREL